MRFMVAPSMCLSHSHVSYGIPKLQNADVIPFIGSKQPCTFTLGCITSCIILKCMKWSSGNRIYNTYDFKLTENFDFKNFVVCICICHINIESEITQFILHSKKNKRVFMSSTVPAPFFSSTGSRSIFSMHFSHTDFKKIFIKIF